MLSRIWTGSSGRNGSTSEASAIDSMLPKFELVPMRTYLRMLAKVRRPSATPSASTPRSWSEQDHVGRGAGDVGGAFDRKTDIGGVDRRRVVDAVAEEADRMTARRSARMIRVF